MGEQKKHSPPLVLAPEPPIHSTVFPRSNWFWPVIGFAVLLVALIYHQVPSFAFTDWDDMHYIRDNALLKSLSTAQVITEFSRYVMGNYHPITMLSYSAEITLLGRSPGAMHVTNLLLHLLNVVLVGLFLRKLTKHDLLSAMVALLWAVHPLRVESVAWLSARKDLLLLFFGLCMLLAYLQWRERERPVWYFLALAAFLLSGLSKAMAVSFVPCLLLIDLAHGRSLKAWRPWTEKLPFAAAALIIGVVAVLAQRSVSTIGNVGLSSADRFWTGGANLAVYLAQQLVPIHLNTRYAYPLVNGHLPAHYPALALIGLAVLACYAWRASKRTWFLFGIGFMLLHLLPVLQWLPVGLAIRADRYTYAAGIGWSLAIGYLLVLLTSKLRNAPPYAPLLLAGLLAVPFAWLAHQRTVVWASAVSVRSDMIVREPRNFTLYMDRAISRDLEGDRAGALADYDKAIRMRPANDYKPYFERGMFHFRHKEYRKAMPDLIKTFQHAPTHTGLVPSMLYAQVKLGLCDEVVPNATAALQLDTGSTDVLNLRAYCLLQAGHYQEAQVDVDRALSKRQNYGEVWYLKAWAAAQAGDSAACCQALATSLPLPMADEELRLERDRLLGRICR